MRARDNALDNLLVLIKEWTRETDLNRKVSKAKALLEIATHSAILDIFLSELSPRYRSEIQDRVEMVEHCAFIGASQEQVERMDVSLETLASQAGFPDDQQSFPSMIVAKELGSLVGEEEIPTKIFKAWGSNSRGEPIGIEVFLPQTEPYLVIDWIARGVGAHIALRVKSLEEIAEIHNLLSTQGIPMPAFMNNAPNENTKEGSTTIYFDVPDNTQNMRLEFYYKARFKKDRKTLTV